METQSTAPMRFSHILISGAPGIGKTTICKKVVSLIEAKGLTCDGFFTEEVRSANNKRIGFDIVPLKHPEQRLPLARATSNHLALTRHRVGNYAIFVENFETSALPVFQTESDVLLLDEVGKMELFSESFAEEVDRAILGSGKEARTARCVLATIPAVIPRHLLLMRELRSNSRCKIFEVDYENRDGMPEEVCNTLLQIIKYK